ncbi:MAG: hypothetical protein DRR19_33495 [Candidatus Parabeggiatoa sp. nov. 1]|nr:MAG: hypothetical protein DRR19_33495 [Gammaproteobacteria bacterium]
MIFNLKEVYNLMKNRMLWKGYLLGVLLIASSVVFAAGAHDKPILLVPVAPAPSGLPFPPPSLAEQFQDLPYSTVDFRWKYQSLDEETQVQDVDFSLKKVSSYGRYFCAGCPGGAWQYVGSCKFGESSIGKRKSFTSSECGTELQPNQWYKWQLSVDFVDGSRIGKAEWFKTGDKRYRVSISVEVDKMVDRTWDWLTIPIKRDGKTYTLKSIYKTAGIDVEVIKDQDSLESSRDANIPFTSVELHSLARANRREPVENGKLYVAIVSKWQNFPNSGGWASGRELPITSLGFASHETFVFTDTLADTYVVKTARTITPEEYYLLTTVHELGHDFFLEHRDSNRYEGPLCSHVFACADRREISGIFGTTIMIPVLGPINDWSYEWSASSLTHFYAHPLDYWKPPVSASIFVGSKSKCHWYPQ